MSNKTTFKRIALAVVAALGFGVLASGPSSGAIVAHSLAFASGQATSGTAVVGTAVTINVRQTITGLIAGDSATTLAVLTKPTGAASGSLAFRLADSSNATLAAGVAAGFTPTDNSTPAYAGYTYSITPDVAGTYTIAFYGVGESGTDPSAITFTLTATAKNVAASSTYSKAALTGGSNGVFDGSVVPIYTADSAIVVPRTDTAVAKLSFDLRNSDDTNTVTGTSVNESITAVISGSGLLSVNGSATKLRAVTTVNASDTIVVWGDNTAGVGTITLSTTSIGTWATKSVTFSGTLSTAVLTAVKTTTAAGNSDTSTILRAVLRDGSGNLFTTAQTMYVHATDTSVINNASCSVSVNASLGYGNCALSIRDSGTTTLKIANYAFGATVPTTPVVSNEVTVTVAGAPRTVALAFDKRTYVPGERAVITVTVTDGAGRGVADQTIVSLFATGGITVSPALVSGTVSAETVTVNAATYGQGKFTYTVNMPSIGGSVVASATGGTGLVAAGRVAVSDTVTVNDPAETAANTASTSATAASTAATAAAEAATAASTAATTAAEAAATASTAATSAATTATEAKTAAEAASTAATSAAATATEAKTAAEAATAASEAALDASVEATDAAIAATDAAIAAGEAADEAASAALAAQETAQEAVDAANEALDAAIAATDAAVLAEEAAKEATATAQLAADAAQAAVDAVTALSAEVTKVAAQLVALQKLLNRIAKKVGVKVS